MEKIGTDLVKFDLGSNVHSVGHPLEFRRIAQIPFELPTDYASLETSAAPVCFFDLSVGM